MSFFTSNFKPEMWFSIMSTFKNLFIKLSSIIHISSFRKGAIALQVCNRNGKPCNTEATDIEKPNLASNISGSCQVKSPTLKIAA